VQAYAEYLCIDTIADADLMYVARYALLADLPPGWAAYLDADGNEFFHNAATAESQYEHPLDNTYREMYRDLKAKKAAGLGAGA